MNELEDSDQVLIDKLLLRIKQLEQENKILKAKLQGQYSLSRTEPPTIALSQLRIVEYPNKSNTSELEDKLRRASEMILKYARAVDFI